MARWFVVGAVAVVAVALVACTSSGSAGRPSDSPTSSSPPSTPATSTTPAPNSSTPYADPQVKPAVDAYKAYYDAYIAAQRHPSSRPLRNAMRKYAFDPAGNQAVVSLIQFASAGLIDKGSPPSPRVSVLSVQLSAKPYPTVSISDCPTPPDNWATYDAKTGKKLAPAPGRAKPPYLTTATLIHYQGRWGVQKASTDYKRSCAA